MQMVRVTIREFRRVGANTRAFEQKQGQFMALLMLRNDGNSYGQVPLPTFPAESGTDGPGTGSLRQHDKRRRRVDKTAGITDLLARSGAQRVKVCFEPDNPASGHLYQSAGFEPDRANDLFTGPTTPPEG